MLNLSLPIISCVSIFFSEVADKVFVSSINKEATNKDIEEVCFTIHTHP